MKTGNHAVDQLLVKFHSLPGSHIRCMTQGDNEATAACVDAWIPLVPVHITWDCCTADVCLPQPWCHSPAHICQNVSWLFYCNVCVSPLIQAIITLEHNVMLTLICMLFLEEEPEHITARTRPRHLLIEFRHSRICMNASLAGSYGKCETAEFA